MSEAGRAQARRWLPLLLVLLAALILGALATRRAGVAVHRTGVVDAGYHVDLCVTCGLIREKTGLRARFRETEFTTVYHLHVGPRCRQQWRAAWWGTRFFRLSFRGPGFEGLSLSGPGLPWYLDDTAGARSPVSPLEGFTDGDRVSRVLTAVRRVHAPSGLRPASSEELAVQDAVWALPPSPTPTQQEQWWRKYHHLF